MNVDARALAELARLSVTDAEIAALENEIPQIVAFVQAVQDAAGETAISAPALRNVMREDSAPHESGIFSEALLAAAPAQKSGRVVVKQVVSRKR